MGGFLLLATATSKPKKDQADAGDAAPAPVASTQTTGPNDIEALRIFATLGCDAKPANVGCSLLREFEGGSTWVALPFPEEVWFGESTAIGGLADGKKELFFLQVSGSAAGFVGSSRPLLPDNAGEARDAAALLAAARLGNALPNSQAATFMKTSVPAAGRQTLVRTSGRSQTFAQPRPQVFIRAKGERLLLVEHNGNFLSHDSPKGPGSALAWVAELFRVR